MSIEPARHFLHIKCAVNENEYSRLIYTRLVFNQGLLNITIFQFRDVFSD